MNSLKKKKCENEARLAELKQQLMICVDEFQSLAMARSFLKLLQSQYDVILLHIENMQSENTSVGARKRLRLLKVEMEKKIEALQACPEVQTSTDPSVRRHWARKVLEVSPDAKTGAIRTAYEQKRRQLGGGQTQTRRKLSQARKILGA